MKLLLIEDSRDICLALSRALAHTHEITIAMNGENGINHASNEEFTTIVLDLHLPDMDGLEVCRKIRLFDKSTPILVLSGESKVLTKIALMDAGADDYLTKPFSLGELKARLRSLERRHVLGTMQRHNYNYGNVTLNVEQHSVVREGQEIMLRKKEFALLECLMQHAGSVVSRQTLCAHAWKHGEDPWTNTVDVHIKYLRDKLDKPFDTHIIKTVHGVGYKLELHKIINQPIAV